MLLTIAMVLGMCPDTGSIRSYATSAQEDTAELSADETAGSATVPLAEGTTDVDTAPLAEGTTGSQTGGETGESSDATGQETQRDWRKNVLIGNNDAGDRSPFTDKGYTVGESDVCDRNPNTEVKLRRNPRDNANLRFFTIWFTEGLKDEGKQYSDYPYMPIADSKVISTTIAGFSVTTSSHTTEHGEKSLPQGRVRTESRLNDALLEKHSWDKADWPYADGLTTSYLFDDPETCNCIQLFFDDPTANDIYVGDIDLLMPCSVDHHKDDGQGHKEGFTFQGAYPADCQHGGYKIETCDECGYARRYDKVSAGGHLVDEETGECSGCHYVFEKPDCINGVYQIANERQFNYFAALVNGDFQDGFDPDNGKHDLNAVLTADITLEVPNGKKHWTEDSELADGKASNLVLIGAKDIVYNGTFDGQGHTITNLFIKDAVNKNGGLFWNVGQEGEIKNLNLVHSVVCVGSCWGTLCGTNAGKITNCFVGQFNHPDSYASMSGEGELAGLCDTNTSTGIIESCKTNVRVEAASEKDDSSKCWYVAGICRRNGGSIQKCYNKGRILGKSGAVESVRRI